MSEKYSQASLKPPLQWPKDGVIKVRYEEEIQDLWACRYGTLTELMKEGVARFGDREMLFFPDFNIRWSYNEFDTVVNNVAFCLQQDYGIQKGERVAIMMNNIPEAFVMYLALAQIGAISVIVNARLAGDEALRQMEDSGCVAVAIEAPLWDSVKHFQGSLPDLRHMFISGAEENYSAIPLWGMMEKKAPREVLVDVSERDICSLIYTSGTTGKPKGTIILHRGVVNNAMNCKYSLSKIYDPDTDISEWKQLIVTPFFHVTTLHTLINLNLMGASAVAITTFSPEQVLNVLIDEEINFTIIVAAMYWILSLQPRYPDLVKANNLAYILQGGSPMPPEMCLRLSEDFPDSRIGNGYGFTEGASAGWLLGMAGDWDTIISKPGSVGGALGNSGLRIVDPELNDVARGETGEILACSPSISPGYWNLPEETAASFFTDKQGRRWFKTGDLGYMDDEGYTYVVDRIKSMICRGGENVYSVELENLISLHPKVLEVGVVGVPDNVLGEKIKAVIWPVPGEILTVDEVKDFCRERIADFKVPDYVVLTDTMLPKNPGGKLMKEELKKM